MSRLSPDSLFHFTSCLSNLLGILDNTFYPRYCYEEFELTAETKSFMHNAIPMVCFCDIPLSQLMNHIGTYGKYGLGMRKEWGIRSGLNPVVYFNRNSNMANNLRQALLQFVRSNSARVLAETLMYLKPYEGILYRSGRVTKKDVRFYDEREWRYVPATRVMEKNQLELAISEDVYRRLEQLADANRKLERDETRLSFNADDIKYIIIGDEQEINQMIGKLREIKGNRYDSDTIDRLASRIITVEQIENDF